MDLRYLKSYEYSNIFNNTNILLNIIKFLKFLHMFQRIDIKKFFLALKFDS